MSCLHQLIEARARCAPHRPAVAFEGRTLTYGELDARANRLARRLQELGAGPDTLVGLAVERSLEMVVGILGTLKAGAAYLPMDGAYPPERLAYMLSDSGARLVLTQASLVSKLPAHVQALMLDEFEWSGAGDVPAGAARSEHLAYVIYTSGSTGRPKGVAIEHRNIVNYVLGVAERLRLEPGMNHAMVSTIAADLGNTVLFPALATGGCLHVVSQERAESQALLADYFSRERIDVLKIVPSHLAALQSGRDPQQVMPLRRLVLGGEASPLEWIERLRSLAPRCDIFNHYGPTETTVGVLTYHVGDALPHTPSRTLPLGRALHGSSVHLLDEQGRAVPAGEKGELYIGGRGVARGYLNRPELTAERFVADPFSAEPGARLYRTGDLARLLPDASLEFCGRVDHQVKLHGFRVELGEIEAALREQGEVEQAVVLVRESAALDKQLVAYVSQKRLGPAWFGGELTAASLREYLKGRLPHYMVPAAFVVMEALPLTPNGKIDRQALAALSPASAAPAPGFVAPRSATENVLAAIWRELLGIERVGVHDDVFDLGAHSLMAMKALARIRDALAVDLALRHLFEHPTIGALGGVIEGLACLSKSPGRDSGAREEIVL